jgi:hypothetical protein
VGTYDSFHSPYIVKEGITGNCTPSSKIKGPVKDSFSILVEAPAGLLDPAQAKKMSKTLISTVLRLLYYLLREYGTYTEEAVRVFLKAV